MKKLVKYILASMALAGAVSCDPKENASAPFGVSVIADAIGEGEPLVVTVALSDAPEGPFRFAGSVFEVDVQTGREWLTRDVDFYLGAEPVKYNSSVDFPSGRRDFSVIGLVPGTYRVEVGLMAGGKEAKGSCVTVVKKAGTGEEPGGGDDPVRVTDFTIPAMDNQTGFLAVEKGKSFTFVPVVTPADATDKSFAVRSSDEGKVLVSVSDGAVTIRGVEEGDAVVYITAEGGKGISKQLKVRVTKASMPQPDKVADFTLPELDATYKRLCVEGGKSVSFTPSVSPSTAGRDFTVVSSDESVVKGSCKDGVITFTGVAPGKASVVISADGGNGITKTVPVLVFKNVKVTVAFEELEASEAQLKTKTFPCKLKFTSDSDVAFTLPIVWSVTVRSVVNSTGHDSQTITDKKDVTFKGNRTAYYDLTSNILIPSYNIWRTPDYSYSLTLSVVKDNPLDPEIWRLTFDEQYRTQDAKIKQYITSIQQ